MEVEEADASKGTGIEALHAALLRNFVFMVILFFSKE